MAENFYNNYYIFNTNYINRLLSISFILIWTVCYIIAQPQPQPRTPNNNSFINKFVSSRGVGFGFIIVSMLLEIIADLITIKENVSMDLELHLEFASLILWNFSLAMKSFAVFIALARYFPLTKFLSKEPILSQRIYDFSIYFNLLSGIMIYPSLVCVLILYKTTWSQSMLITEIYYIFQMIIGLVFFLILNRGIKEAIDTGILVDRYAIQQFRIFHSKNLFMIGFLACEIFSLSIFNLNQLAGRFIQRSFGATTVILGFITLTNSAVYVITVIILSFHFPESDSNINLPNGKNHTLSDFTNLTVNEVPKNRSKPQGFSSIRLKSLFKKHNIAAPLSNYAVPNKEEFEDVELGNDGNDNKNCAIVVKNDDVAESSS